MHKFIFKILFALTPSPVKAYFARRIEQLKHEVDFLKTGIREAFDAEGYRIACSTYEEMVALTKKQMKMRNRKLQARSVSLPNRRVHLPFVARLFRAVSKWLARWAKSLDHKPVGEPVEPNGRPQLQLELEK